MSRKIFSALLLALVGSAASASTLYSNDFETGGSLAGVGSVTPVFWNKYWSTDGAASFSFNVAAGSQSTGTQLSLMFGAIDTWDNGQIGYGPDAFTITVDNTLVFSAVFDNYQNQGPTTGAGITSLGYGYNFAGNVYNDAAYQLTVSLGTLAAGNHTVTFAPTGPGWQGGSDESVALDNIQVTGTVAAVPEAGSVSLVMAGAAAVLALSRRRRAA